MSLLLTCIMPTADRPRYVPQAIRYFLAQDYPEKELLILDDGREPVGDMLPKDERIRYVRLERKLCIGAKRNLACREARGEIVIHWDDDDWSAPWRLTYQAQELQSSGAEISGLNRMFFFDPHVGAAWEYQYSDRARPWVYGATLAYRKKFWERFPFPEVSVGEDSRFVWRNRAAKIHVHSNSNFFAALVHGGNTSRKHTTDKRYQPRPLSAITTLLGEDWSFYSRTSSAGLVPEHRNSAKSSPRRAVLGAGAGIGDIIRVSPLIRVLHELGYEVDLLLAADFPEVADLYCGAPELRSVHCVPRRDAAAARALIPAIAECTYELGVFTTWGKVFSPRVRANLVLTFDRSQWLRSGDSHCAAAIARELGWNKSMPEPFVVSSDRDFGLAPGTVVFHPGCKSDWYWKRWHGFPELAERFEHVAVVGSPTDLENSRTYFAKPFAWPEHVRNHVGKLSLSDTAALIRQSAALIANDSGLMHLGVAVGVPTFGIFGITSPAREAIPSVSMVSISKGLACEPACRAGPWGRRDCAHHLRCMKTLTPDEVVARVSERVNVPLNGLPHHRRIAAQRETLNLTYYGYVFDASGYGHAARAYLHALHAAGVELSVVDLARHPRQVEDPLVASLVARQVQPDFHLFHGIPPQWARQAFPLRNVIAMTVWETDGMPTQWRNALNHAMEVWLPCDFNTAVFSRVLDKDTFKLPHPIFPPQVAPGGLIPDPEQFLGVGNSEFVFYAIFEWQERKCPDAMIESYLRAFPSDEGTVLVVKTNPGAQNAANAFLARARQKTGSLARVELRCEAWCEAEIESLHRRGDCYVSLHRGEGWCYPLFEAVSRGKQIVATAFAGPMEYLDPGAHLLVRHQLERVQQRYIYYHPTMSWARPDFDHFSHQLRQAFQDRAALREKSLASIGTLKERFSLDVVGVRARDRLLYLLRKTNPEKARRLELQLGKNLRPPIPIPGDWYDADYFVRGIKSNWANGYTWTGFQELFTETARFLVESFPEADSFLDAGSASGFLVQALSNLQKDCQGFDHSPWAIENARPEIQSRLTRQSAESFSYERQFDMVLAFGLLESLTEEQIEAFLSRARLIARQGIIASILCVESREQEDQLKANDRDLSHITLRTRSWWHEQFIKAGWKQDALHRAAQRSCQAHNLPQRMKWALFVYAA